MSATPCCCRHPTCGLEGEVERSLDRGLSRDTGRPAQNIPEASRFLQLPAEIRILIYGFLCYDAEAKSLICLWPSAVGPACTSSLVQLPRIFAPTNTWGLNEPHGIALKASDRYRTAVLQTSKLIHVEATPVFYASPILIEQMYTLRQKTDILHSLVDIEIEDPNFSNHLDYFKKEIAYNSKFCNSLDNNELRFLASSRSLSMLDKYAYDNGCSRKCHEICGCLSNIEFDDADPPKIIAKRCRKVDNAVGAFIGRTHVKHYTWLLLCLESVVPAMVASMVASDLASLQLQGPA